MPADHGSFSTSMRSTSRPALSGRTGALSPEKQLLFSPSGAIGRYEAPAWFQYLRLPVFCSPLRNSGGGGPVDGQSSAATARIDHILYDDRAQLRCPDHDTFERSYPDMRIVTIDQGLDILGMPKRVKASQESPLQGTIRSSSPVQSELKNAETMNDTSMLITGIRRHIRRRQ